MQTENQKVVDLARQIFSIRRELHSLITARAHHFNPVDPRAACEKSDKTKVTGYLINANGLLYHVSQALIDHLETSSDPGSLSDLKSQLVETSRPGMRPASVTSAAIQ